MKKDTKLGDTFPVNHTVRWGSMEPHGSRLSDEWAPMRPTDPSMSEKWVDQTPSKPVMSEKWVDMDAGSSEFSDRWHEMKQEGRDDPYSMAPSPIHRKDSSVSIEREKADNRRERSNAHSELGTNREI